MQRGLPGWTAFLTAVLLLGCKTEEKVLPPGTPLPEGVSVEKADAKGPKRTPKATTCVSVAQYLEAGGDLAEGVKRQQLYDQAIAGYKQALELDPRCSQATIRLARLHEKLGQIPLAVAAYKNGLAANPHDAAVWCEYGMFHGRQKRFDEAIRCLHQAVALEPQNQFYHNYLGWCLARAGRFQESFEHFSQTLGPARAHCNVARMARHIGREDVCQHHLQEALKLDPNFAEARALLVPAPEAAPDAVSPDGVPLGEVRQAVVEFPQE